jgi:hypothetical protein
MSVNINLELVLAIISILGTLIASIVAIVKVYSRLAISLTNINNQQVQTNTRLVKIETMLMDMDTRIEDVETSGEQNTQDIAVINERCRIFGKAKKDE